MNDLFVNEENRFLEVLGVASREADEGLLGTQPKINLKRLVSIAEPVTRMRAAAHHTYVSYSGSDYWRLISFPCS
jgi:hypothetical protein